MKIKITVFATQQNICWELEDAWDTRNSDEGGAEAKTIICHPH